MNHREFIMHRIITLAPLLFFLALGPAPSAGTDQPPLSGVRRVVFLGDSITYSGQYIEFLEACLRIKDPSLRSEFLDLGLPSETVSGLSEPGHAGGQFPRPELRERLDRVLAKTKPDLVVACYGMNDGIYYPFGEDRFEKYQEGLRSLRDRAEAAGAKILHLTPPVFDPTPIKAKTLPAGLAEYRQPFEGYDEVLARYSDWLLAQKAKGWDVVDVHGPMKKFLDEERARDPNFRLAGDGVHINAAGHWLIAREVLAHWDIPAREARDAETFLAAQPKGPEVLKLVQQKQRVLKDAWLTDTGHKRPGMKPGLPLEEAKRKATEIDAEIRKHLTPGP
jgi:lysophospholipase L1-like esterase